MDTQKLTKENTPRICKVTSFGIKDHNAPDIAETNGGLDGKENKDK